MLLKKKHDVTISLSGKLPTYPSPNSTTVNWHHVKVNVGLGEGYVGSCPDTDIVTSCFFFSNIKNVEFFLRSLPFCHTSHSQMRIGHHWFLLSSLEIDSFSKINWCDISSYSLSCQKTGFYRLLWNNKTHRCFHVSLLMQIHL